MTTLWTVSVSPAGFSPIIPELLQGRPSAKIWQPVKNKRKRSCGCKRTMLQCVPFDILFVVVVVFQLKRKR